jgi:multisubunit Na+/H+ antiporter MnhC subunit
VVKNPKNVKVGSVFDLLGKSYQIVKDNWQMFAVVNIFAVLYAVMDALNPGDYDTTKGDNGLMFSGPAELSGFQLSTIIGGGLLILLLFMAVNFFFFVMGTSLEVKSSAGKKPNFSELFNDGKKYFFPLLGLVIILAVVIGVGLLLLIVPGIIAIGRLAMAPYIMIDKKVGIEEAMKQSNELGKKYFGKIWAAILLMILVAIVTGIISAIPILGPLAGAAIAIAFSLILALRYRELGGHKV